VNEHGEQEMISPEWDSRTEALALTFVRRVMTAAGIEHSHLDDVHLAAAIQKSTEPGVRVVDEKGAREWTRFGDEYDYYLWQATRAWEEDQSSSIDY
jgi:hypothetical protein